MKNYIPLNKNNGSKLKRCIFSPEQIAWLKNNVKGKAFSELTILLNNQFKTDFTTLQIKSFCNGTLKLKNGLRKNKKVLNEEALNFLKKYAHDKTYKELTVFFNKSFNFTLTEQQVRIATKNHKIKVRTKSTGLNKEMVAFIMDHQESTVEDLRVAFNSTFGTSFTKRQINKYKNYYKYDKSTEKISHTAPLYSERESRSGFIYIKVSMTGPNYIRWIKKHHWIWEQAYGKIPAGMVIIYLDKNRKNCILENLAMITREELRQLAYKKLYSENKEATLAGITVVQHSIAIHKRVKEILGEEDYMKYFAKEYRRKYMAKKASMENKSD